MVSVAHCPFWEKGGGQLRKAPSMRKGKGYASFSTASHPLPKKLESSPDTLEIHMLHLINESFTSLGSSLGGKLQAFGNEQKVHTAKQRAGASWPSLLMTGRRKPSPEEEYRLPLRSQPWHQGNWRRGDGSVIPYHWIIIVIRVQ